MTKTHENIRRGHPTCRLGNGALMEHCVGLSCRAKRALYSVVSAQANQAATLKTNGIHPSSNYITDSLTPLSKTLAQS
eukprot:4139225-Amphidinium_carterae.1